MTKARIIEAFKESKEITEKHQGSIYFFIGALCSALAWNKETLDYDKELNDELMQLIKDIH